MRKALITLAAILAAALTLSAGDTIKVACVGNSITYGTGVANREVNSYPSRLQRMLGEGYDVRNFGHPGATLLEYGHNPYVKTQEYADAIAFAPDIAVIHLGVNDTDPRNWPNYSDYFHQDYLRLIESFRQANPDVRIIISLLTPLAAGHPRFKSGTRDWRILIQDAIRNVAQAADVELIDLDTPLKDRYNLLAQDNVHPDADGAAIIAQTVYSGLTGNYGGLWLPEVYGSGMVIQRGRFVTVSGRADAGAHVTVTLAGQTATATADNRGEWSVTLPPLATGTGYVMTVTDGNTTLTFDDIAAGEVWLASGQSNMEFKLRGSYPDIESENPDYNPRSVNPDVANATDSLLRFFNMKEIDRTDNIVWDSATVAAINDMHHFQPTVWQRSTPESAVNLSAIAYYYARTLRDSLQVPVGIILNAVGGSTTESWIDIETLQAGLPETLVNWHTNDYTQKWAQGRALRNTGSNSYKNLHPYGPAYLFATGIRPLGTFDIAGAIWYQGESNAHNIEVHERLFPLLVESWRKHFRNPDMPFYFVQLSSINRPSWPTFRDSQRRLALQMDGVEMAVSFDYGDSLDVHPRQKSPIGQRLGRIGLNRSYGYDNLEWQGPTPESAVAQGNSIIITFSHADGLKTSDGHGIRTFEIAEIEGFYQPADAEILSDGRIKLTNKTMNHPRYARYGWQPFSRANLVNSDNLPASTFSIVAVTGTEPESGYDKGISAPYIGTINGRMIVAGGCNFPENPMARDAKKKFYEGIYEAETTADGNVQGWRRIGALPEGMAYGASATVPQGIVLIGGTTASKALSDVSLLSMVDGQPALTQLPSLPSTLDNAYAAAIGNVVYVAGGNFDGTPSNDLFSLDMSNLAAGWKKLKSFPGNPRVQPVVATAKNAKGEETLYLWGGFAGKGASREASLDLDGYVYNPAKNKWTAIEGPKDASGDKVSTGGGVAVALPDGTIAVTGGVNKDIFLGALRNQPADYLDHPIEWYAFNPNLFMFNPATETWTIVETTPEVARAGAGAAVTADGHLHIVGGELKPRIRTPHVHTVTL